MRTSTNTKLCINLEENCDDTRVETNFDTNFEKGAETGDDTSETDPEKLGNRTEARSFRATRCIGLPFQTREAKQFPA